MNYDKAHELAREIRASEEYRRYKAAKEKIEDDPNTLGMLAEYKRLQLRCQAAMVSGERDDESMEKLQRLVAVLQMNPDAAEYVMAELILSRALGDVYKILAEAAGVDTSMFEGQ